jgi:hypothetical protein
LVPLLRPSPWLPAARKLLLRLLLRPLRLPKPPRPRPPRPLTLLLRLLRRPPKLPARLLPPRSNLGNEIGSAKPVQVGNDLPGFSILGTCLAGMIEDHR